MTTNETNITALETSLRELREQRVAEVNTAQEEANAATATAQEARETATEMSQPEVIAAKYDAARDEQDNPAPLPSDYYDRQAADARRTAD